MRRLTKVVVNEVSLVKKPANRLAFVLRKSDDAQASDMMPESYLALGPGGAAEPGQNSADNRPPQHPQTQADKMAVGKSESTQKAAAQKDPSPDAVLQAMLDIDKDILGKIDQVTKAADADGQELPDDTKAALEAAGRILAPHRDKLQASHAMGLISAVGLGPDADADADAGNAAGEGVDDEAAAADGPDADAADSDAGEDDDELLVTDAPEVKRVAAKKSSKPQASQGKAAGNGGKAKSVGTADDVGYAAGQDPANKESDVAKSEQHWAERLRKHEEALAQQVRKSDALQHMLDRKEFIAKAEKLPHLGASTEVGDKLHALYRAGPELYKDIVGLLKAANDQLQNSSLYEERGSRLTPPAGAEAQIESAVSGIVQKSNGKMSQGQAFAAYFNTEEGRQQYSRMRAEQRKERGF